jgi:type IV pilus biogenesis protein CpaD/CtpE
MYKYKTLTTLVLFIAAAGLSACYSSAYDADRGESVRSMISNQTLNPSALETSPTETTGQDAQKADAVLEAYRGSVGDAKNIKARESTTIQFNR